MYIRISNNVYQLRTDGQTVEYLDVWDSSDILMIFDMQWQY